MSSALTMNHAPSIRTEAGPRSSLSQVIVQLVDELNRLREDLPAPTDSSPRFERWTDPDHVYLEAALQTSIGLEADVSIQGGRVFLCVRRQLETADAGQNSTAINS